MKWFRNSGKLILKLVKQKISTKAMSEYLKAVTHDATSFMGLVAEKF